VISSIFVELDPPNLFIETGSHKIREHLIFLTPLHEHLGLAFFPEEVTMNNAKKINRILAN
jgi:hypothetical protein